MSAAAQGAGRAGSQFDLAAAAKEALIAAAIAFALALTIIGMRTVGVPDGLGIEFRWNKIAIAVGLVFFGRLGMALFRQRRRPIGRGRRGQLIDLVSARIQEYSRYAGPGLLVFAIAVPVYWSDNRYVVDTATLVLTYVMLGWGLNIVVGLAGLLDLGYVAFYAVGAYSYALVAIHFDWSFWVALPVAGMIAAGFGILLGFPVLRLRGDYLAIVTLGFGEIVRVILINWYDLTNGPDGLSGIPRPSFFGMMEFTRKPDEGVVAFHQYFGVEYSSMHRIIFLYYLILTLALITNLFTIRIRKLPIGRAWEALREDEIACRSLGVNPTNTKLTAFSIGAMFGGFAGSFFATRQGFISPESFSFAESAVILAIVVLGGMGSQVGVVLGAVLLIGGIEALRDFTLVQWIGIEPTQARMLIFGALMVAIMVWRPRGLLAHREPTLRLSEAGNKPS